MKKVTTRLMLVSEMSEEAQQEFISWAWDARFRTTFQSKIIGHPRTVMFSAEKDGATTAYLPTQTVLMAEAFIPDPESSEALKAISLGRLDQALVAAAKNTGIGDVYCYIPASEPDYMSKVERHGWKEVKDVKLFRKSVIEAQ